MAGTSSSESRLARNGVALDGGECGVVRTIEFKSNGKL